MNTAMQTKTAFRVRAGSLTRLYFTEYHAEQLARALRLNGMTVTIDTVRRDFRDCPDCGVDIDGDKPHHPNCRHYE